MIEPGKEDEYVKENTKVDIINSFKLYSENKLQEPLTYSRKRVNTIRLRQPVDQPRNDQVVQQEGVNVQEQKALAIVLYNLFI